MNTSQWILLDVTSEIRLREAQINHTTIGRTLGLSPASSSLNNVYRIEHFNILQHKEFSSLMILYIKL